MVYLRVVNVRLNMKLENIKVNVGICPECKNFSSFIDTPKKQIFVCHICNQKVKQHVNGKVLYKSIEVPGIEIT